MTLNEVMKDTADAIREKTGKSELIKPVDFATEIKGISDGGGGGAGGLKYYRNDAFYGNMPIIGTFLIKYEFEGTVAIMPPNAPLYELGHDMDINSIKAFAFDPSAKTADMVNDPSSFITMMEFWEAAVTNELHEITEAEFYDLNA